VRELSWGPLTHSEFDFSPDGRTITLVPVVAQRITPGLPPSSATTFPGLVSARRTHQIRGEFCTLLEKAVGTQRRGQTSDARCWPDSCPGKSISHWRCRGRSSNPSGEIIGRRPPIQDEELPQPLADFERRQGGVHRPPCWPTTRHGNCGASQEPGDQIRRPKPLCAATKVTAGDLPGCIAGYASLPSLDG
jgi:hypothetical protein